MMLTLVIDTINELYAAYMPFIKDGCLFVKTEEEFDLGAQLCLNLTLPGQSQSVKVDVQVVWKTPVGAPGAKPAGIGVQFLGANRLELKKLIVGLISEIPLSHSTYTL